MNGGGIGLGEEAYGIGYSEGHGYGVPRGNQPREIK
jgi:hypothetical protein